MKKLPYILLASICIIGIQYACSTKPNKKTLSDNQNHAVILNVNDFETQLAKQTNVQLIDVRTPGEFEKGYIKGAINIDYQGNSFTNKVAKLDKNKPTFVYCQSGGRSSESCHYMANQGFKELYDLDGGMTSWTHYKKPVETK